MHKLTSTAAASMLWLAVLSIIQLARCDDAQIASLNLQASQDGALPPAVPRSSLFYQLVRDAVQKLHPGVLQANSQSHRHLVLAKELEPYVVQGFLMHNYSESDALEALNLSVSLHPGQRARHRQHLGRMSTRTEGDATQDLHQIAADRIPVPGAMLLPTYHIQRTVWLLWFQGWPSAPWLVQEVAKSWERHNPGWEVVRLDKESLAQYMNTRFLFDQANKLQAAAQSDLVRLTLLSRYGGVWADATMLCFAPLDSWVYPAIQPVGLWMYHGRDNCNSLASWFIVAAPGAYLMQTWTAYSWSYWRRTVLDPAYQNNTASMPYNYFWMDALWTDLLKQNKLFSLHWQQVPKLCCEDRGQSHMLAGKVQNNDLQLKKLIADNPPWAMKLTKSFPNEVNEHARSTNGYYAIMQSYKQRAVHHVLQPKGWI